MSFTTRDYHLVVAAMRKIRFTFSVCHSDRNHLLNEDDITILLSRLPEETYARLRAVHFNDSSWGVRWLGYVTRGHRDIAICALPPRVSFARFLRGRVSPQEFGAQRGRQWPALAMRRFMLYDVFLHELGHLQVVNDHCHGERHTFAREAKAQEFADRWRRSLWREHYDHPDPAHNAPTKEELQQLTVQMP